MNKLEGYSNPKVVLKKGKKLGYNISISTRKNKKYQVETKDGVIVHFGAIPYEDYTLHHDEKRRQSFLKRNWRWATQDPYSASFLSYWLLWN